MKIPAAAMLAFLISFSCAGGDNVPPVSQGVLDLSRGLPQSVIRLNGEWAFFWERLVVPGELKDDGNDPLGVIAVPGAWNGYLHRGTAVNPRSFGTYRMRIKLPPGIHSLALQFPELTNPNRIWVNGVAVTSAKHGEFEREMARRTNYQPFIHVFEARDAVEIIAQMANTNHLRGGMRDSVHFGRRDEVLGRHRGLLMVQVFLAGIQLVIALYHLALFFLRRGDRSNLFFAFFCFVMFIRTGVTGENFFTLLFPGIPWLVQAKLEALTFYLGVGMAYHFIRHLFPNNVHRVASYATASVVGISCTAVVLLSPFVYPLILIPFQAFSILVGLYCFFVFYRAFSTQPVEVILILCAWIVIFVFTLNDILYVDNILGSSGYLMPLGIALFITIQSFVISLRFSRAFDRVEHLSDELEEQNRLLEERVRERTLSLSEKNSALEKARDIAGKDMAMAVNVQRSILPEGPPESDEWDTAFHFRPMSGVSGDFYDFYAVDGRLRGAGVFDVSGHGISSGLVAMIAKWVIFRRFIKLLDAPLGQVFSGANTELVREIGNSYYYLTGALLKFDGDDVTYCNAGHQDAYVRRGGRVAPIRKEDGGIARGALLGIETGNNEYEEIRIRLEPGDFLLILTDGIIEATGNDPGEFGTGRLTESMMCAECATARDMLDKIIRDFDSFIGGKALSDDATIVVFMKK